tara:strand:+ start:62 stop:235 length:174 start_codon:yes stop_codon:yes gene_type:complete
VEIWTIIFGMLLTIALFCGWLVWVSRFVWESKELAVKYASIAGAATLGVMIIGMEKL